MDEKEKIIQEFQAELENAPLPERLAETYRPESCLTHREDGEVWLLRDKGGERYILKTGSAGRRSLAREFALLGQLLQELEGRVPRPVDCFEEGGVWYLLRTYLPGKPLAEIQERGGPLLPPAVRGNRGGAVRSAGPTPPDGPASNPPGYQAGEHHSLS